MGFDRRTFLKVSAMAAATAMLEGNDDPDLALPPVEEGVVWNKAPCRFCGTGCHVQVGVQDGKVVAIAGDPKAAVNKGLLCVKGYHVGGALYGADRLTKPMKRVGDTHIEISWEEAIGIIADKIEADQERFAFYGSGQWTIVEGFLANLFMKGGLSNNHIDPNARLCMASAVTGFLATFGVDEPAGCYDDYDTCDVAIMWGNNPAEMHPVLWSRITDRRLRGEKVEIIDIGTRRTRTTEQADRFLCMKPHGDLAIALGILHELVRRDAWDKDFVGKHCSFRNAAEGKLTGEAMTFEAFTAALQEYTPERCAELSGLSADDIRSLADLFTDPKKRILSSWCMGMNQHTRGTAINCLVHSVHLFSGHWGKPGDNAFSLTGQPSACGTAREVGTLAHALPGGMVVAKPEHRAKAEGFWNLPEGRIKAQPGFHTVKMWEEFCKPDGGISTIWVQVTNPGQSLPNLAKLFDGARQAGKFLIVSDVYPTVTTRMADLILPSAMWVEKNGLFGNSERRTHQWFKMVEPPGQARDDTWQIIAVARALHDRGHQGMRDKDGKFLFAVANDQGQDVPIWDWAHWQDVNVDRVFFERYRPFTRVKHKNLAPYDEYVKARGLRWPVVEQSDGTWKETRWRFVEVSDPNVAAGKGIDFYHGNDGDGRAYVWFHPYAPPAEVPDADYPFMLCTGRVIEHWHTGSMTMRIPQLRRAMPHAYVEVNPVDASRLNIHNGDTVILESRRGKVELPAWINGRGAPPEGSLFIPFFDERLLVNQVTLDAYDPFSKEPDYKKSAVRMRRKG
jgi:nitrate reductase (cytochrome)